MKFQHKEIGALIIVHSFGLETLLPMAHIIKFAL